MKKNKIIVNIVSLLLFLCVLAACGAVTAFAVGEDGEQQYASEVAGNPDVPAETQPGDVPDQQNNPEQQAQSDYTPEQPEQQAQPEITTETEAPAREPMYEYIYGYNEDVTSAYEAPKHLQDLPAVTSSEVVEATAVVIPDVAVSDATMFSGIVMWLCVALGIAVIVGVLVSKRTRRRGV